MEETISNTTTNVDRYSGHNGDKVITYKNGVKYSEYTFSDEDGMNGGYLIVKNIGENSADAKQRVNAGFQSSGEIVSAKYSTL